MASELTKRHRRASYEHNPMYEGFGKEHHAEVTHRRLLLALLVAVPAVVIAAGGILSSDVNRQKARWTSTSVSTSSTAWRDVPGLANLSADTIGEVSATLTVTVQGAPMRFRIVIDGTPEARTHPASVRFVPSGGESFSSTFVRNTATFEGDDTHVFTVQWRSPTGGKVTLQEGVLNLVYELGTNQM